MADYGNTLEPGITTDLESALSASSSDEPPATPALIGQADLNGATDAANPNEVHLISRLTEARNKFGDESTSLLTQAFIDCKNEGGAPVFMVAAEEISDNVPDQASFDSVSGSSGVLPQAPVIEDASEVTFTVDGTDFTTSTVYDDPANETLGTEEAAYRPTDGSFELSASPSSTLTAQYSYYDYKNALLALEDTPAAAESVDILGVINENDDVRFDAQITANNLAADYDLALLILSGGLRVDPTTVTQDFDDSRIQTVYPSRGGDGTETTLGAYVGERARLGLDTTPINQRLETHRDLLVDLSVEERGQLIDQRFVPLAQESAGARIADDPTTVDPSGSANDRNVTFGFSRMVLDYIIETAYINERPFIGKLNSPQVRQTLEDIINDQLRGLLQSNVILGYNVSVEPVDATSVALDIGVETAKPLRNIHNNVTVGDTA